MCPLKQSASPRRTVANPVADPVANPIADLVANPIANPVVNPVAPANNKRSPSTSTPNRLAMIGLTPKSGFLGWLRKPAMGSGAVLTQVMNKELKTRRHNTLWHFTCAGVGDRPKKRMRTEPAAAPSSTDVLLTPLLLRLRTGSWIWMLPSARSRTLGASIATYLSTFLLCRGRRTFFFLFACPTIPVFSAVRRPTSRRCCRANFKVINGDEYYQLRCSISGNDSNELVTSGVATKMYSQSKFETDCADGKAGFQVSFANTSIVAHFTWKFIVEHPITHAQ